MDRDDFNSTWASFPRTTSNMSSGMTSQSQTPSLFVLETMSEGIVKIKVEPDVMAYILYCHYSSFTSIQQRYSVAITWSSEGKSVLLCATNKHYDHDTLVAATQEFLHLYYHLMSQIVACKLNDHVNNITLHQFHKASLEIKKHHPRVMIKEIRGTGNLALYGLFDDVTRARVTFINTLTTTRGFRNIDRMFHSPPRTGSNSLPRDSSRDITSPVKRPIRYQRHNEGILSSRRVSPVRKDENVKRLIREKSLERQRPPEILSPVNMKEYRSFENWKKMKILENLKTKNLAARESLEDLRYREPRHLQRRHHSSDNVKNRASSLEPIKDNTRAPSRGAHSTNDKINRNNHVKVYEPESEFFTHFRQKKKPRSLSKEAKIPDIKSPFNFLQNFKESYSFTTPSDVTIQVLEGDVTHCDCDVIVHETDEYLRVGSEMAWTVAKYGAFNINKQLKLYSSLHGKVPQSKVVVTSSCVDLPSMYVLHAVAPEWREDDIKRSRKLLFNTYKNVFKIASENFKVQSIALPVFGINTNGSQREPFPLVAACDVMYQALVALIKLGTSLKHLCYVSNDPKHVNAIVTSIRVKIENVNYEPRFLRQPQLQQGGRQQRKPRPGIK